MFLCFETREEWRRAVDDMVTLSRLVEFDRNAPEHGGGRVRSHSAPTHSRLAPESMVVHLKKMDVG